MECTAEATVADGSQCRIEACSWPVLVARVVFHWPALSFGVPCEAEQAFHYTGSLAWCAIKTRKREPPTEGSRLSPHSRDVVETARTLSATGKAK